MFSYIRSVHPNGYLISSPALLFHFVVCVCQNRRMQEIKQQADELLLNEEESARQYLMYNVMPVVTQGLIELCRIRPNDAIDFLVGFSLFIDMFLCSLNKYIHQYVFCA